jgi:GT2 family glycosyltransferase
MSCAAAQRASPGKPIIVIDASTTDLTRQACARLLRECDGSLELLYRRARRPGLARQRNEAISFCRQLGAELVHFIDDDTEVTEAYFEAIEARFREDGTAMGVGGVVVNQPQVNFVAVKRLFLLGCNQPSSVLRSGRNVLGQYPDASSTEPVDWLIGCSMSFRLDLFDDVSFDDAMEGYSLGEDYDFSFRASRKHRLVVEPRARCTHHFSPILRGSARAHAQQSTEATHRWVRQHAELGMSSLAFWWSTLGDLILHLGYGVITAEREALQSALGVLDGVLAIARRALADTPDDTSTPTSSLQRPSRAEDVPQ